MTEIRLQEQNLKQAVSDDENIYNDRSKRIDNTDSDDDEVKSLISNDDSLTIDQIADKIVIGFFHYLIIIAGGICYTGYFIIIIAYGLIIVSACDLDINTNNKGWLTITFTVGTVIGGGILGPLGDAVGRRTVILTSLAFNLALIIVSAFTYNYIMLVIVAFLNGFSIGGSFCNIHAYSIEFFPRRYRGRGLVCVSAFLTLGSIYTCGIALAILPHSISIPIGSINFTSWRLYLLVCAIPVVIAFCLLLYLPNSIRFIIKKGDENQLLRTLTTIDRVNSYCQRNSCMSAIPVHRYFTAINKDKQLNETRPKYNYFSHWRKFTQSPWKKRAPLICTVWLGYCFGVTGLWIWMPSVISYYTSGRTCRMIHNASWIVDRYHHQDNTTLNCIQGRHLSTLIYHTFYGNLLALPVAIICALIINRIGRKWLCCCLITLSAMIQLLIMLIDTSQSTMILASLYYGIANNVWLGLKLWTSELFPTELRSTAFGFANIIGSSAIAISVAIFARLFYINCVVNLILLVTMSLISAIACMLLPDTTNADIL